MKRILMLALLLVTSLAMGQDVAQQQPQKPKPHGFKARLCAMSTDQDSPAFDSCMTRGLGHQHPSQPAQPAASQPQVAPPQIASQQPVVKNTPVQVAPQQSIAKDISVQVGSQQPVVKDTPVQIAPPQPVVKDIPVQAKTCIEYMTTTSGAQTCLRWKEDQDQ